MKFPNAFYGLIVICSWLIGITVVIVRVFAYKNVQVPSDQFGYRFIEFLDKEMTEAENLLVSHVVTLAQEREWCMALCETTSSCSCYSRTTTVPYTCSLYSDCSQITQREFIAANESWVGIKMRI